MKNSQYLKQYVQNHPENKMAWYLLGKEYLKSGQEGKANYCFNQAGGVYEAFEHSKVPADLLRDYEERLLEAGREKERRRLRLRRSLLALILALLALIPANAAAPGGGPAARPVAAVPAAAPAGEAAAGTDGSAAAPAPQSAPAFTAREAGAAGFASAAAQLAGPGTGPGPQTTAVLGMERAGRWLLWREKLPLSFSAEKDGRGKTTITAYDAAVCSCTPGRPDAGLAAAAAQWQAREEERAVLASAVAAFRAAKGRLPAGAGELAGDYPGNWLTGLTPAMERELTGLLRAAASASGGGNAAPPGSAAPGGAGADGQAGPPGAGGGSGALFSQPLEIIVDKANHRLALVSGNVILRNYKVGLGGERTPEGRFVLTDKVVNPNGKDDGDFGSRGMQLSDTNYAIHGTNEPDSIGKDESLGCVRMGRADIEELFDLAPRGTPVSITKGVLPDEPLHPQNRLDLPDAGNQTNPRKVYRWLN
ncbi:L,D-transpeptidase [Paenibacillus glufosinatiresistens]|uniref:L,D-transpeptidase n=1 Tax=Paenibacillus glufosinatiresistens TaxID=3070657 RepID=UPI00286EB03C|nr:L,D-transpeptidase [Paenibacillus sp. YX.27]